MIIYRPHRGGLAEAMAEAQTFEDTDAMKAHILQRWNGMLGFNLFNADDIVLNEDQPGHPDDRIGWRDTRYVCVKRIGSEVYDHPQCIGMWATDFDR